MPVAVATIRSRTSGPYTGGLAERVGSSILDDLPDASGVLLPPDAGGHIS